MRRLLMVWLAVTCNVILAMAGESAGIKGKVTDASAGVVPGVEITVTNVSTGAVTHAAAGPDGMYTITGLASGTYTLQAAKPGFLTFNQKNIQLQPSQNLTIDITLQLPSLAQSVVVQANAPKTSVTSANISQGQIQAVGGPIGGAAQALSAAPGVNIYGYGGISATARSEIVVRGIKTGWSSVNGDIEKNGIMFLLDGIPMNNMIAANGHWEPTQLPIMPMISELHVTYGPGDPAGRWFDSLGGTVDYVPVQPSGEPGFTFSGGADYGSYDTRSAHLILRTGAWKGWSAVLSSGYTANNTFRTGTFNAPSQGWAGYAKVRKLFKGGNFSLGYYMGRNYEYRPNFIPLNPVNQNGQAITTEGLFGTTPSVTANAPLYSQPTSGYYSSLPGSLWFKLIRVNSNIVYSKLNLPLSPHVRLHDTVWYRHGYRLHYRVDNYFGPGNVNSEWYDPTSNTYGNQASFDWDFPRNLVTAGGYLMHGDYNTPTALYNPALGTSKLNPNLFNSDHLYNNYGLFYVQDRVNLLPDLIITPGVSEQLFQTSFFNSGAADFPDASSAAVQLSTTPDSHKTFWRFSPSLSAQYLPLHRLAFHGNYAETYQNPIDRAFGVFAAPSGVDLAALLPVKSQDAEGGVRVDPCEGGLLGRCSIDATYFRDKLSDETMEVTNSEFGSLTQFAFGSAIYNGVALSFDEAPTWHLQIHGNATLQHDYFLSYMPEGFTTDYRGFPVSDSPDYTTNLGLSSYFNIGGKGLFTPQVWWQYVGERFLFSNAINAPTRQTMPGYGLVNLTLSLSLNRLGGLFGNVPLQASFGIYNLFNKQYDPTAYITSGGYFSTSFGGYTLVDPGAPREYAVSINVGF